MHCPQYYGPGSYPAAPYIPVCGADGYTHDKW